MGGTSIAFPLENDTTVVTKSPTSNPLAVTITIIISKIALPLRILYIKGVDKSHGRLSSPMMLSINKMIVRRNDPHNPGFDHIFKQMVCP